MITSNLRRILGLLPIREVFYALVAVSLGIWLHAKFADPKVVIHTVENTKIVTVNVPVLTEKIVTKYLTDPKDKKVIHELLAQNDRLKLDVLGLTQTIAELKQKGGTDDGGVVTPPKPDGPEVYTYHDFQLDARYMGTLFNYDLHQTFEVLSTTGRAKDGSKVALTNVFQIGKDGERVPIPAKSTAIFADEATVKWFASPRVQAGFGVTLTGEKDGVVAVQWLKRGKSKAAEDVYLAVLSPAVLVGKRDVGVLPFSLNLGRLPHQPFTNLWVSPFVSRTRAGVTLTATF